MARQPQDVIKAQLGSLMAEIAILTSQVEQKDEEIAALKAKVEVKDPGPAAQKPASAKDAK